MNKNKTYPDEYKLTNSLTTKITFLLVLGPLVWMVFEFNWSKDGLFLYWFYPLCVWFLFVILQDVEYAIFNHKGVLIVHTKRWGKNKAKQEFYIDWKDVKYIRLKIPLSKNSSPKIEIVSRVLGHGYSNQTFLPYGKFASLAKYYSGREDIIYKRSAFRKKKKMYEKDW
jgi:hypothetical protein